MDDERELGEVDARVRAAVMPGDAQAQRVVQHALADEPSLRGGPHLLRYAIGAIAAVVLLATGARRWLREPAPSVVPALSVVGHGSTVIVNSADGRRWLLEPAQQDRPSGNYVIALRD